jgi:hypothetical protein
MGRGERVVEAAAGSGVRAQAALDSGRFVAGTRVGDVFFYKDHGGRGVEESASIAGAHSSWDNSLLRAMGGWRPRRSTCPRPGGPSNRARALLG